MRIEIELTPDLERYFQYIPNHLINTVVLSLLTEAVHQKSEFKINDTSSLNISELEVMLSNLLQQTSSKQTSPTSFKETTVSESSVTTTDVDIDDLGDLGDFMDLIK